MHYQSHTPEFKMKVVLESFQRDTKPEQIWRRFGISRSQLYRWRQEFQIKAPEVFRDKRDPKQKAISQGYRPGESPEDFKKIIRELTLQIEILKKAQGLLGN